MNAKRELAGLLILLAGSLESTGPLHAAICKVNPNPGPIAGENQTLPLKFFHNYLPVVAGRLPGFPRPQNFVLDTGTSPSILNAALARQLGLATKSSALADIGKMIKAQAATLPRLELGPIRVSSLSVQVEDLSPLEDRLGTPIAGVIGLDVLSKSSFRMDYDKGDIVFGGVLSEGIPVRYDPQFGFAVADMKIAGRSARMLVDTGTDRVVLFGGNFADLSWLAPRNTELRGKSLVSGDMPVQVFSAPDILLGDQHFSKDRAYLVPGSTDPVFDGLLGVRALGFHGISYDQTCGTIYLLG
jgi:Aspartyl protease